MDLGLQDRTVIVTGASGGIGRRLAAAFAREEATIVVTYRSSRENADRVAAELGGAAIVTRYDQAEEGAADALVADVLHRTGRVDVLVNNAVQWPELTPATFDQIADESWLPALRGNIEGAIRLSRAVAAPMRAAGWGRLVHISSNLATEGSAGFEYYGAAKAALHGFSRSAAFSLGVDGDILSNVALLGLTRTETNTHIIEHTGDQWAARSPLGRLIDADEVAPAIVFLASAANTGITGQIVQVTGGM